MAEIDIETRTDAASRIGRIIGTAFAIVLVITMALAFLGLRL